MTGTAHRSDRIDKAAAARMLALLVMAVAPGVGRAQPVDLPIAPATGEKYPNGVRVRASDSAVYTDAKGRVLYGLDMRTVLRSGPDPSQYCTGACAETWEPLLAPTGTLPNIRFPQGFGGRGAPAGEVAGQKLFTQANAPDWTVIAGAQGPQWVYKGWHMVFVRRGKDARSTAFDGAEGRTWNTLKFIPPVPKIAAPGNVKPIFVDGRYVLATEQGHVLFTGTCVKACPGWQPFPAGMASARLGEWTVRTDGDSPQWAYRGKLVYISQEDEPTKAPSAAKLVRP